MKEYTFKLVINEGNDEFWEAINKKGTGCDDVLQEISNWLTGFNFELQLVKFENHGND